MMQNKPSCGTRSQPYASVICLLALTACSHTPKYGAFPGETYEPQDGIMDRWLRDCAGVMRARYGGLLEDPNRGRLPEEIFRQFLGEYEIKPDSRVDLAQSETLYGTEILRDELLFDWGWRSAQVDWAYFEAENWQMKKYPVLGEFRNSLKRDKTGEWYIYIWNILDERGRLPQDPNERRIAPIRLMEQFAIELKNHLAEHGFGDNDWLRAAMCSEDYDFFGRFIEFYLYELLEVGLPHEGAFQSARADVVVEYGESQRKHSE